MAGLDARNGAVLEGYAHVEQSIEKILATPLGQRVMREWAGNPGTRLLGENLTEQTILLWFNTVWMLIELFEPRFRITRFVVNDATRLGEADFTMLGEHKPYAHLDWEQAAYYVDISNGTVRLQPGV